MSSASAVTLGALLAAAFLAMVAVMVVQEVRRRPTHEPAVYALDQAVAWIRPRLDPAVRAAMPAGDVLRVLEWQVHLLQQEARRGRPGDIEVIVGRTPESVDAVLAACAEQGAEYDPDHVAAILELQGGYLETIGALGSPVDERER